MRRVHPIEVVDGIFHVTSRGNGRAEIFRGEIDFVEFLRILAKVVADHAWVCHAFCVLPNHYHLLVETPDANLARGMQRLNGAYARGYNARHRTDGHVFGGPYRAMLVERDTHFLELCRYIALNPVRAGLCERATDWQWSSYGRDHSFVDPQRTYDAFGGPEELSRFVAAAERPQPD